jgi:predicted RNA-binding protein with PIN domain
MHLLIDGHNLIGQIPDISLADPDDEGKLVMLLRRYSTAKRGRQVVVVFDHGVYGHPGQLNGYGVTCYFARSPQDADAQIIRRLSRLERPREWALVTSDRQLIDAAQARSVQVIDAREFAGRLQAPATSPAPPAEQRDVRLSEAEIEEWLKIFGEWPEQEATPLPKQPSGAAGDSSQHGSGRRKRRKPGR